MNRRDFFRFSAAIGLWVGGAELTRAEVAKASSVPSGVGRKFYPNGQVRPFAGNTIICHTPQQGEHKAYFNALLDIYREASVQSFAHKIAFTPPSSYHMTIFGGANDQDRNTALWPRGLSRDASMDDCNDWVAARLKAFKLNCALPIRMKVDLLPPVEAPLVLRLLPYDEAENVKLRTLISRLSECLEIYPEGIDKYAFHTTLGYAIQWLDAKEDQQFQDLMKKWRDAVARKCPQIQLGAPEFCTFEDMFAFQREFFLE